MTRLDCRVARSKAVPRNLARAPFTWKGKPKSLPYCAAHGLRIHGASGPNSTYAYYNGPSHDDDVRARLRNFVVEANYVRTHVLDSPDKAETHRLAYELSEDAVTWNGFVGLLKAGALAETMSWLAGRKIEGEPALYLWGHRVDLQHKTHEPYEPLAAARRLLEPKIVRYHTEPDVMLVVPEKLLMFIEAKFASGNTLAAKVPTPTKAGEKPKDVAAILARYYTQNSVWKLGSRYISPEGIGERFQSQLFRNIVFAAGIAETLGCDWHVANLTRSPRSPRHISKTVDYGDPSADVKCYLTDAYKRCFTFKTWEELYARLVKPDAALAETAKYMKGKSAHLTPAFEI